MLHSGAGGTGVSLTTHVPLEQTGLAAGQSELMLHSGAGGTGVSLAIHVPLEQTGLAAGQSELVLHSGAGGAGVSLATHVPLAQTGLVAGQSALVKHSAVGETLQVPLEQPKGHNLSVVLPVSISHLSSDAPPSSQTSSLHQGKASSSLSIPLPQLVRESAMSATESVKILGVCFMRTPIDNGLICLKHLNMGKLICFSLFERRFETSIIVAKTNGRVTKMCAFGAHVWWAWKMCAFGAHFQGALR